MLEKFQEECPFAIFHTFISQHIRTNDFKNELLAL